MGQKSYGKLQNPGRVCFMHNNETHIYNTKRVKKNSKRTTTAARMSAASFLKFFNKSIVLNTARISKIEIQENGYKIHVISSATFGVSVLGNGILFGDDHTVTISRHKHPDDYTMMRDWLIKNE